jgi:hypothetical protein
LFWVSRSLTIASSVLVDAPGGVPFSGVVPVVGVVVVGVVVVGVVVVGVVVVGVVVGGHVVAGVVTVGVVVVAGAFGHAAFVPAVASVELDGSAPLEVVRSTNSACGAPAIVS